MDKSNEIKHRRILKRQQDELTLVRKELKIANEEVKNRKELLKMYESYKLKKVPAIKVPGLQAVGKEVGTVVSLLSDVHGEEKITRAQTNGFNSYNPDICKARMHNYFKNLVKLTRLTRNGITLNDLVVAMLGDMIHGFIHPEYQRTNYMTPIQATHWMTDILRQGFNFLRDNGKFTNITVICKIGNHSRTTQKVYTDEEGLYSHEWGIYQILAHEFPEFTWVIDESYFTYMNIYNKVCRFHHGHAFRYMGGVGGIYIPMLRYIFKVNRQIQANMDFIGHWHTQEALLTGGAIMNGSVCGASAYSIRLGFPASPPMQTFQIIDARRGFTANFPIILE